VISPNKKKILEEEEEQRGIRGVIQVSGKRIYNKRRKI